MFTNPPLGWHHPLENEATNALLHFESELCWRDPIVEIDENGNDVVIHREVTWN